MKQLPSFSIIICAHDPKPEHLARTLEGLKRQTLPLTEWELLLVDNRSREPLAASTDLSWHPSARHVREEELGKVPAFLRGIRESRGAMLVMVDDDNVLDPDYLSVADRFRREKPWLGAFSGQCVGEFETPPPDWTRPYHANLAVREFQGDRWSNLPWLNETMPNGAGMCIRREVAEYYLKLHDDGKRRFQIDRVGKALLGGGDNDLAASATDLGLAIGLFEALKLKHLIPAERLTEEYLLRIVEGTSQSGVILLSYRGILRPPASAGRLALDFVKLFFMEPRHRRFFLANRRGEKQGRRDLALTKD